MAKLKREVENDFINEHRREIDEERVRLWEERVAFFQTTNEAEIFAAAVRRIKEQYGFK